MKESLCGRVNRNLQNKLNTAKRQKEKSTPKSRINAATSKGSKITFAARNGSMGQGHWCAGQIKGTKNTDLTAKVRYTNSNLGASH